MTEPVHWKTQQWRDHVAALKADAALFAASWERMVLLAVYVGPCAEWEHRFEQAILGFHKVRGNVSEHDPKQDRSPEDV